MGHGEVPVDRELGGAGAWGEATGEGVMEYEEALVNRQLWVMEKCWCAGSRGGQALLVSIKAQGMGGCRASGRHMEGRRVVLVPWEMWECAELQEHMGTVEGCCQESRVHTLTSNHPL